MPHYRESNMMTIKSKFRLGAILLFLFLLTGFGVASFIAIRILIENNWILDTKSWFGFGFVFSLFILGLIYVFAFTKTIVLKSDILIVKYLFRFKTYECKFDNIDGYRWKYINQPRAVDYKSIKIKTKENIIFTISDFEYSNLRELEKMIVDRFALKITKKWIIPNPQETDFEFKKSNSFDIEQAKDIRVVTIVFGLCCILVISFFLFTLVDNARFELKYFIFILPPFLGLFFLVNKLLKTNKYLKEKKNEA